jgi:ATP-dependent RNA helicase SUPV3L1/SUV3
VIAAPHEGFAIQADGTVSHDEQPLGKLTRGTTLLLPDVRLGELAETGPGARSRLLRRVVAFVRDWVAELLAPLRHRELGAMSPEVRGLAYQLEQGLGTILTTDAAPQIGKLEPAQRTRLAELGIEVGQRVVYVPVLLRQDAIERRLLLGAAFFDGAPATPPRPGAVSLSVPQGAHLRAYAAIGFPVFGSRAARADVAERVHRALASGEHDTSDRRLSSLLGCPRRDVRRVAEALSPAV